MGEQAALAYDPQGLERLLVSRETLGMLTANRRHSEAPHLTGSNPCLDHPPASYFPSQI